MANSTTIPRYLYAKSERDLERSLLLLQAKMNARLYVLTIYPKGTGVVAWYTASGEDLIQEASKEIVKSISGNK